MEERGLLHKALYKPNTHDVACAERGTPNRPWLQLLYIYYLAWKANPDESIRVREVKKQYNYKIKEYGFDKFHPRHITNRSLELYKYGYLTKIKADDGSNHNLYRINDNGLEKLESKDIIPPSARKKFVPITKLVNPRVFQMVAPK